MTIVACVPFTGGSEGDVLFCSLAVLDSVIESSELSMWRGYGGRSGDTF